MNANDVIESYVNEVALQLPRKQRNDVAFELRSLLQEELQAKADAIGRTADEVMVLEFLNGFGHPNEVASRYLPSLTIIEPSDGQRFLRLSLIGLVIIWVLGLILHVNQALQSGAGILWAIVPWWGNTVIPSLWWPGLLVVSFGLSTWVKQRWPQDINWKPSKQVSITSGRATKILALFAILCGIYILLDPRWVLDVFWNGKAAPAAYTALTYSETFLQKQAIFLLALIMLNIPLFIAVIIRGSWNILLKRLEMMLSLILCAVMLWVVVDGPILMASSSDKTAKFFMVLILVFILIDLAVKWMRKINPSPSL